MLEKSNLGRSASLEQPHKASQRQIYVNITKDIHMVYSSTTSMQLEDATDDIPEQSY